MRGHIHLHGDAEAVGAALPDGELIAQQRKVVLLEPALLDEVLVVCGSLFLIKRLVEYGSKLSDDLVDVSQMELVQLKRRVHLVADVVHHRGQVGLVGDVRCSSQLGHLLACVGVREVAESLVEEPGGPEVRAGVRAVARVRVLPDPLRIIRSMV